MMYRSICVLIDAIMIDSSSVFMANVSRYRFWFSTEKKSVHSAETTIERELERLLFQILINSNITYSLKWFEFLGFSFFHQVLRGLTYLSYFFTSRAKPIWTTVFAVLHTSARLQFTLQNNSWTEMNYSNLNGVNLKKILRFFLS